MEVLSFLGIGRVPFVIVLCCFALVWGISGLISNQFLSKVLRTEWLFVWPSLMGALVCSTLVTHTVAKALARVVPKSETYALAREDLPGMMGEALYTITPSSGAAHVRTPNGLCQVYCRVDSGQTPIAAGRQVLLIDYNPEDDFYLVEDMDLAT